MVFQKDHKSKKLSRHFIQRQLLLAAFVICSHSLMARISLPQLFSDNMVLHHGKRIHVWGTASPGQAVTVSLFGDIIETGSAADGKWEVWYQPKMAGQRGELNITAGTEKLTLKNVMVGEVWICSGQSNMEFPLSSFKDFYAAEIKNSKNDWIRFATVQNQYNNKEQTDAAMRYSWTPVNENSVGNCSAVAYFFARKLFEQLRVPIGIIITSWGGTPAQAWMDETGIESFQNYAQVYKNAIKPLDFTKLAEIRQQSEAKFAEGKAKAAEMFKTFLQPGFEPDGWEETTLPGAWENSGHPDFDGLAAYRVTFDIPATDAGKKAILHLPAIDDIDSTYLNGVFLGSQKVWNELRTYTIQPGVLQAGRNVLTIWVEDGQGGGGLNNDPANYYIEIQERKIPLKGLARLKLLLPLEQAAQGVNLAALQNAPCVLFNGMIAPLLPFPVRGVIWYQGESNVPAYEEYRTLFPAMINRWRARFGQADLPFLFVQLSSFNPSAEEPALSDWAFLREAQEMALKLPNTGMAVSTDIGDQFDIHPKRKKEVGERLAANAFRKIYGFKTLMASGPVFEKATASGKTLTLNFSNTGSGLMFKGDKLQGFVIAGADKKFYPAKARLQGGKIILESEQVPRPKYARYAWANAPLEANLYNKEGFPAVPFRTDK